MTAREVRPPDLEMQVRIAGEHGKTRLVYTLHSPTGAVAFAHRTVMGAVFEGSPEQFQRHLLRKLEQLDNRCDIDGSLLLRRDVERKLVNLGRELWRELIPLEVRHAYPRIRSAVRSWMIVSDEPWIPWELIKPYDATQPGEPIDDDFLCLRFELTRWLGGDKTAARQIVVRRFAVLRTADDLPHAAEERDVLVELARPAPGVRDVSPDRPTAAGVVTLLESTGVDLLHFVGHGTHAGDQPDEAAIPFPDGSVLRPADLEGPAAARIARDQPLVFLNVCWAGQQGWTLTRLGGWAARWVQVCGCGAFIAPLWPVRDKAALAFTRAFYEALSQGATLGEAGLQARRLVAGKQLGDFTALAYTLYGHPNARLWLSDAPAEQVSQEVHAARLATPRQPAALAWLRRQWRWPKARRRWIAAALWAALVALLATGGRWIALADWADQRSAALLAGGPTADPPVLPTTNRAQQKERPRTSRHAPSVVPPSTSTASSSAQGIQLEVSSSSKSLRAMLLHALEDSAASLTDAGATGWALRIDLETPRMSPFTQDGLSWESCRLLAYCRARHEGGSLNLGPVSAVNSQTDGDAACEAAVGDLAKSIVQRWVTTIRKENS